MRTLFEDTDLKADIEDQKARGKESKGLLVGLWLLALLFLGGTWSVYQWTIKQPAPTPPPPPVSLTDPKQTTGAIGAFIRLAKEAKWEEAEGMLSMAAKQKLAAEQKTLRDSLLGNFKDLKLYEAITTASVDESDPNKYRQDCNFFFSNDDLTRTEQKIVPITLIIENGKLAVDSWEEPKSDGTKKAEGETGKKA
jgi:hypothetical protein